MIKKNQIVDECEGITVMEFGSGDIGVTHVIGQDYTGVLFKNQESREIGSPETLKEGITVKEYETEVAMTFTNVESINVVIGQLQQAKMLLNEKRSSTGE